MSHIDKGLKGRLLLPILLLGIFLASSGRAFSNTLLVDIASSFKVSIGTASQLGSVVNFMGLVMGFVMGALTLRFRHKLLFLLGAVFYGLGILGLSFAPNFSTALLNQLLTGAGVAISTIMVYSLIGGLLPLEKRGWAVGLAVSAAFFTDVLVAPISGLIADNAGWRSVLLWFIFPISVVCLILGSFVIPSKPRAEQPSGESQYSAAFKEILLNKSAVACLVGTALFVFAGTVPAYAVSFYRIGFSVPRTTSALFSSVAATGGIFGAAVGGRLVNRWGRKPLTVTAALISGIFAVLFTFIPNVLLSVAFWVVSATAAGMALAALNSLVLEQVPGFRASMMSVNHTFQSIGVILGLTIGGLVLNLYANNFQLLMTIFGASCIALAPIVLLLTKDPTRHLLTTDPFIGKSTCDDL